MRRAGARIVAPSMVLAALVAGGLVAGPGAGQALADGSGGVQPPSPQGSASSNGSTYTSSIGGGNPDPASGTPWTPPACWMQPFFPQTETWKTGDPSGSVTDADSYYSWFVSQGASPTLPTAQMTSEFQDIQNRTAPAGWTGPATIDANDVWWAPDMLNSSTGFACAQGMAAANKLSNGYIGLEPPLKNGQQSPLLGAINVYVLSQIALAEITLPTVSVVTSPASTNETNAAVVNTPTYVAVKYKGDMDPSKIKSAGAFGLAPIWASVQATIASVSVSATGGVSSTTGFNDPGQTCATVDGKATSACSVTFSAPSGTGTPDKLQVSVTWKVTWSTSAGTGGTFPNTGSQQATKTVTVNEIQSQT